MKEKNIQGLTKNLRDIKSLDDLQNVINKFLHELEKYSTVVVGEFGNIVNKYKLDEDFTDLEGNNYEIFLIPQSNNQKNINALRILAHGPTAYKNGEFDGENAQGRWCVREEYHAKDYLSRDNFYVVYKNGKVFAGLGNQKFNCVNRINEKLNGHEWSILLNPFLEIDSALIENNFPKDKYGELYNYVIKTNNSGELWFKEKLKGLNSVEKVVDFCIKNGYRYKEKEDEIIEYLVEQNDVESLYNYAIYCIRNRFKQDNIGKIAEMTIAKDSKHACDYAIKILGSRWPQNEEVGKIAEMTIAQNAKEAVYYSHNILLGRWPQDCEAGKIAEMTIAQNFISATLYAEHAFIDKNGNKGARWPIETGLREIAEMNIAKDFQYASQYSSYCIKGRWPQDCKAGKIAEMTIAKSINAIHYIKKIISDNIDEKDEEIITICEIEISKRAFSSYKYAVDHIKNRWPQNKIVVIDGKEYNIGKEAEKKIAKNKYYAFLYTRDVLTDKNGSKGARWPDDTGLREIVEKNIAKNAEYAYFYAMNCIKGRWPQDCESGRIAEINIAKNKKFACYYAIYYIKDKWYTNTEAGKIAQQTIMSDNHTRYEYDGFLLKNGYNMNYEVKYILKSFYRIRSFLRGYKNRWPLEFGNREKIEMTIAMNEVYAYEYARDCIKGRWPQNEEVGKIAEENIRKNKFYWREYCELLR